jgi:hypothetical protein
MSNKNNNTDMILFGIGLAIILTTLATYKFQYVITDITTLGWTSYAIGVTLIILGVIYNRRK